MPNLLEGLAIGVAVVFAAIVCLILVVWIIDMFNHMFKQ